MLDFSRFNRQKIMITGGVGLIGSALARRLLESGAEVDILLVDSLNENFGGNLFNIGAIRDRVRVNISDIRDTHGLRYLLRDCDIIFNLAGQTSHLDSMSAPFEDLQINCLAQLSLLEACREINPDVRIIYASTRQVYGRPQYLPVDERHPVNPVDVNGINKVSGESYHLLYHTVHGLPTTVLRLTNTYGPHMRIRDARQIFLGIWVKNLIQGKPFEVWGGAQRRDFLYVDDAADAFIAAALSDSTIGKVLNVGGSDTVTLEELAQRLAGVRGSSGFQVCEFPADRKRIDIGDYFTDDTAFRQLTGWQPLTSLADGLSQTVDFYRKHIDAYLSS
ncbi:MAG TPA: NAD-dependent epimerase/dehydratase family protein [Rhodopseudomonas sp.]|uniref:NAD-dependent epimerase/dehydratase family protein n=1 Tax=Rhodopseudomonas sp. TaxID=1078 RepID=UPI002ED78AB1